LRFCNIVLAKGSDPRPLGKNWIYRFIRRNPSIKTKVGRPLSAARATYTTKGAVINFFDLLESYTREKGIISSNIANMDENGLQEGETSGSRVPGSSLTRRTFKKASDNTNWVTIAEYITPTGQRLTPLIIFQGATLQVQWFPEEIPDWQFCYLSSGWINSEIALLWLRLIYLPETKPENPQQWRILLLDNHSSHISWLADSV
jgi:4-hydroxybenzoate polyprenyltransferase